MNITPSQAMVGVAGGLAVVSLFKPQWPIVAVAVLLIAVAILIK